MKQKKLAMVKKWFILVLISFIFFIIQSTFSLAIINYCSPALVFSFAICCSMFLNEKEAAIFGIVSGFFLDCFSSNIFLVSSMMLLIFCSIVSYLCSVIISKRLISATILFTLSYLTYSLFTFIFEYILKKSESLNVFGILMDYVFPTVIYSTLITPLIYLFTKKIYENFENNKIKTEED